MKSVKSWLTKLLSTDSRRSKRQRAQGLVAYYWDGASPMAHEIQDISATGLYLLTKERWHPGTVVTMTLQKTDVAEDSPDRYIAVQSKVIRFGKDGVGFLFVPLEANGVVGLVDTIKSTPVGKKELAKFLEELKSDQGHVMIGYPTGETPWANAAGYCLSLAVPGENVMKKLRDESGQALMIAVLCMTCLMGFVALAADVGIMFRDKRVLQTAADGAAIAGAAELNYGDAAAAAQTAATQNGITNGSNGVTVAVNVPPHSGVHVGNANYVEVVASQVQPTFFMRLFNKTSMTVAARAVATNGNTKACIYTLGTSGPDLSAVGNVDISVTTCGIVINSGSSNALSLTGNATLNAQAIGIVGGYSRTGNVTITPTPVTGVVATSDPLAYLTTPTVSGGCSNYSGGSATLTPGCYNGLSGSGNITLNLNPGVYVINGNFSFSGNTTINGTGVTLVLEGSTNLPGNVNLKLSAPLNGPYSGLLIYQPASNTNSLTLTGNSGSTFKGIVYAPGAGVSLNGNSGAGLYADFVVKSLSLVGNASFQDYSSINSNTVLTSPRLVE